MTDRGSPPLHALDELALGEALADLGASLQFPPTPALATAVGVAIRSEPAARPSWSFGRPLRGGLALGLVAALLVAGLAAAIGFALGGLRITFGEPLPGSPLPDGAVNERAFGDRVALDQVGDRLAFAPLAPTLPELGVPDHAYVAEPPSGGALALIWGDRPGLPADPESGIGLVLTEFRADIGPDTFEKMLDSGVSVESTIVNGAPGYWIEGGEHFYFYRDADGQRVEETLRLVGSALVWEQAGLTLRIEGAPGLEDALRIAASLAPLATD
ncbi:MAG TPA: hypothetical protein VEW45_04360 [Candidatus Dormibacteraeota bacterium]|nr:hypothetical protein [Candidatus Dormibacteraeota bacterium]